MKETTMQQFLRIANARLRSKMKNKRQRSAWAAKMWSRYYERQRKIIDENN